MNNDIAYVYNFHTEASMVRDIIHSLYQKGIITKRETLDTKVEFLFRELFHLATNILFDNEGDIYEYIDTTEYSSNITAIVGLEYDIINCNPEGHSPLSYEDWYYVEYLSLMSKVVEVIKRFKLTLKTVNLLDENTVLGEGFNNCSQYRVYNEERHLK